MSFYFSRVQLLRRTQMHAAELEWLAAYGRKGEAELDHALLWTLFPGDGVARDFVFRREQPQGRSARTVSYLIVSARRPVESRFLTVECKPYAPHISAGEVLHFDLRANPVVARRQDGKSHRHDVLMDAKAGAANPVERKGRMDAAAREWLTKRAPRWGFQVREETLRMDGYRQIALPGKGRTAGFSVLDYRGVVTVIDGELLQQALLAGVGHARSYGCGLLLLKRVR